MDGRDFMNYFLKSHFFGKNPGILLSKIGPKHLFFQMSGGVSRVVINSILLFHCSCIMPVQKWFSQQHCQCILIKKETFPKGPSGNTSSSFCFPFGEMSPDPPLFSSSVILFWKP